MKSLLMVLTVMFSLTSFALPGTSLPLYVSVGYTGSGGTIPVYNNTGFAALIGITSVGTVSGSFVCNISSVCTRAGHDLVTGEPVQVSSTSILPTNISAATNYYAIKLSDTTFSLASSLANAQNATAITITSVGTGTHTIGGVVLAGGSLKLQGSMDGTNWVDLPIKSSGDATKSANITATGNLYLSEDNLKVNYVRVYFTLTAGALNTSIVSKIK